jgi:hypothetical protein
MATTTKTKFKKNDDLMIRTAIWSDYKDGKRERLFTIERVSGYEYDLNGHRVFVRKKDNGWWVVSDYCTGLAISDSHKTRYEAVTDAERKLDKYEQAIASGKYEDSCQEVFILAQNGPMTKADLENALAEWHRDMEDRERENRERAREIVRNMGTAYDIIYDAYDKVTDDDGRTYRAIVDRGLDWAKSREDLMALINQERTIVLDDGTELPNPVISDREFAALAFAVWQKEPLPIAETEWTDSPSKYASSHNWQNGDYVIATTEGNIIMEVHHESIVPDDPEPVIPEVEHRDSTDDSEDIPSDVDGFRAIFEPCGIAITQKREGCCIWASGDTEPHKDALKEHGFRWSPKRRAWYLKTA